MGQFVKIMVIKFLVFGFEMGECSVVLSCLGLVDFEEEDVVNVVKYLLK